MSKLFAVPILSLGLSVAPGATPGGDAPIEIHPLDDIVAVGDGTRRTVQNLLDSIALRTGVACVLDPAVRDADRTRRLMFEVHHVTGYEALAALAHSIGLNVVVLQDVAVFVPPETMPAGWLALATEQRRHAYQRRETSGDHWQDRLSRRGRLAFVDVTLSAAIARLRKAFRTDVLATDVLWARQELVSLPGEDLTLEQALTFLVERLGARVRCQSGVAWLVDDEPARREGVAIKPPRVEWAPIPAVGVRALVGPDTCLDRRVTMAPARRTPSEFLSSLAQQAGVMVEGFVGPTEDDQLAVDGRLGDIIEAARLIWRQTWWVTQDRSDTGWIIRLDTTPK